MAIKGTRNEITIEGRLGRAPEGKFVGQKGAFICQFSLATIEEANGGGERTIWHDVKVWNALGQAINETADKGDQLCITGYLDVEEWDDRETGKKRRKSVVIARSAYKKIWPKRKDDAQVKSRQDERSAPLADSADGHEYSGDDVA